MSQNALVFHLESEDDPHLLARLVGLVVRKGGRLDALTCTPALGTRQSVMLRVRGCRRESLWAWLSNTAGVVEVRAIEESELMELKKKQEDERYGQSVL